MWLYKSPIGNIYIKRLRDGRYGIVFDGEVWESCPTPQAAADDVFTQSTGCSDWDLHDTAGCIVPTNLSEWEHI